MTIDRYDSEIVADIRRRLDRPLVLIGLMGVGKTRIGHELAAILDLPFHDSDEEIEAAADMTIAEIFEKYGEPYFRDGEHRVIKRLLDDQPKIVSTGGGALMTPDTAEIVWAQTVPVWIRADLEVMVERTARNDKRPLLRDGDPAAILAALMEKRYPVYGLAPIVVESHNGPVESIIQQALDKIHNYLKG